MKIILVVYATRERNPEKNPVSYELIICDTDEVLVQTELSSQLGAGHCEFVVNMFRPVEDDYLKENI